LPSRGNYEVDRRGGVLKRLGLDYEILNAGCFGMAGSFGYEPGKYEISVKSGERLLLPTVRNARKDTLIIADGFSCREQIEQLTNRQALHLAEVLRMALYEGPRGPQGNYPEKKHAQHEGAVSSVTPILATAAGALVVGAIAGWFNRRARVMGKR
jgi:hypothetical protein